MIRNRLLAEERRLARMKARQEEEQARQQQSQPSSQMQVEPGTQSVVNSELNVQNVPSQQEPPNYWAEDEQEDFDSLVMDQM